MPVAIFKFMGILLKTAFKYSCIYFFVVLLRSIYNMITFNPGANAIGYEAVPVMEYIYFYLLVVLFCACLIFSHREYIKQTPQYRFSGILGITLLFLLFTYGLGYLNSLADYHLFYKKQQYPETGTGLNALIDQFSRPAAPRFEPWNSLFWYPLVQLANLLREGRVGGFLHELLLTPLGTCCFVIYYEALYGLFRKYGRRQWYDILPVVNKWRLIHLTRKPNAFFFALLAPVLRTVIMYFINQQVARNFKKNGWFALGMTLFPPYFYGVLGLDSREQAIIDHV